jgi:DNA-binding response OmpR family regulator
MKRRILLLDDDIAVRESLAVVLADEGFTVLPAGNASQALATASNNALDLVLLDLNLPRSDGWEIFQRLTAAHPLLPVIVITARSNQLFTALSAGAGALLEKPLNLPHLLQTIRRLLDEPREMRFARAAGQPASFEHRPGLNASPPGPGL